jgi:hypothetical protein
LPAFQAGENPRSLETASEASQHTPEFLVHRNVIRLAGLDYATHWRVIPDDDEYQPSLNCPSWLQMPSGRWAGYDGLHDRCPSVRGRAGH